jgi:alanyl-tRNA synthetase
MAINELFLFEMTGIVRMRGDIVFDLYDTKGYPVAIFVDRLAKENMVVDWEGFITSAKNRGWTSKHIHSVIEEAISFHEDLYKIVLKFMILTEFVLNPIIDCFCNIVKIDFEDVKE